MLHLILLFHFYQLVSSVQIVAFTTLLFGHIPTITNDSITLSIELDDCSTPCSCHVQVNRTGVYHPAKFTPTTSIRGIITVKNLKPYTLYMFEANCSNVPRTVTYMTRTDVGRPLSPRDVVVELKNGKLHLKWLPPLSQSGPITLYRIIVDGKEIESKIPPTQLSYEMKTNYVSGTKHIVAVTACNFDTQNRTLCSDPKQTEVIFGGKQNTATNSLALSSISSTRSIANHLKSWQYSIVLCLFILFDVKNLCSS